MTMSRRVLAWLFLALFLVGSLAAPVRSSSRGGRNVWGAADAAGVATAGNDDNGYEYDGGKRIWNRRSLGRATTKLPPAPVSNKMRAAAMPAPPSPTTTRV